MGSARKLMAMKVGPDHLLVSEIFDSIQGEGPSMGRPSTFLRLGLCNLRCAWCDTPYTWKWDEFSMREELRQLGIDEVASRVGHCSNLVITGGEPLLQREALTALLQRVEARVEVETAGTLGPGALADRVAQWNVSPKLSSSANPLEKRFVPDALDELMALEGAVLKLVIGSDADLEEAHSLVAKLNVKPSRVWLMPEGTDAETLREGALKLVPVCTERGYNLSTRLHVLLWGDRRGV